MNPYWEQALFSNIHRHNTSIGGHRVRVERMHILAPFSNGKAAAMKRYIKEYNMKDHERSVPLALIIADHCSPSSKN
jgi:hypothetical protein